MAESHGVGRPRMPRPARAFLWISGIAGMALFLTPAIFALKYYAYDKPAEDRRAAAVSLSGNDSAVKGALSAANGSHSARDLSLLCRIAQGDADPLVRLAAVQGIGVTVRRQGTNFEYPMECLLAKSTLSDLAIRDPNSTVRAAASSALGLIAARGAVIQR